MRRRAPLVILLVGLLAFLVPTLCADAETRGPDPTTKVLGPRDHDRAQLQERRRLAAEERSRRMAERKRRQDARVFRGMQVPGEVVRHNVDRLLTLAWQNDLAKAKKRAQAEGKPILWIQALGDLDGFL